MPDYERPFSIRPQRATETASRELSHLMDNWLMINGPTVLFRTCASCKWMPNVGPAVCEKYNMTPPIDTIMRGCDDYVDVRLAGERVRPRPQEPLVHQRLATPQPPPHRKSDHISKLSDLDDDIPF